MTITVAENAGFCFGVKRATDEIERLLAQTDRRDTDLYTLGELIHNPVYISQLAKAGVQTITIEDARQLAATRDGRHRILIVRTHGVTKEEEALLRAWEADNPHFHVTDMTCPFVKRIHNIAETKTAASTLFFLLGHDDHPEVRGIMSHVQGEGYVFSTPEEFEALLKSVEIGNKTVILAAQTTQSLNNLKKCKEILEKLYTNAIFFGTICSVTETRQTEAVKLASQSDAMIVIGGRNSSNTKRLYELCRDVCPKTLWVEESCELPPDFHTGVTKLGITAGASTPGRIIMEVYKKMSNETQDFAQMLEESFKSLHTGETVTGTVMSVSKNEIQLDLGTKVTGTIVRDQITDDQSVELKDMFNIGDQVTAFVIRVDDANGVAQLSKKRVDADKNWINLVALYESGDIVEGTITEAVKGGLLISVAGSRVFIPASHSGLPRNADLTTLVGTTQRVRLIDMDAGRKRALASIRVVKNEERKAKENEFWADIEVGKHYNGVVKNMTSYGAFVDLGGVDGMVHKDELSWRPIRHPSAVVSVGQELDVYIKAFDPETKRISLGYKSEENDTWRQFVNQHQVGDVMEAKVVSILPFGAFAQVYDGVDGLIHISQISLEKIANPGDVLKVGDVVTVKLIKIDDEKRELSLSIRALLQEEKRAEEAAAEAAAKTEEEEREAAERAEYAPYIVRTID